MRRKAWSRRALAAVALVVALLGLVGPGVAHASDQYLDIDITNQVLSQVVDGEVVYQTHISTGSEEWYWNGWDWEVASTPRGWFEVYRKDPGWEESSLGWLYDALYFYGGYAVHGSESVPDYPASHGCVRVPLDDADYLFDTVGIGTPVFVHD
jgi:lipoprotein-anchoring transpeptidase ErfK/SrfK